MFPSKEWATWQHDPAYSANPKPAEPPVELSYCQGVAQAQARDDSLANMWRSQSDDQPSGGEKR